VRVFSFRNLRILALLALLAFAFIHTKQQRLTATSWLAPIQLVIYPIAGDARPETIHYLEALDPENFGAIERFMEREAERYNLFEPHPVEVRLGPAIDDLPPPPPWDGNLAETIFWSLRLRVWAWRHDPLETPESQGARVRMYVIYQQGDRPGGLEHSFGLPKGLVGGVHAYALERQTPENNVVIVHELLHTLGATDKYDHAGRPIYPEGYGEPGRSPLHPQRQAEIMAGKIPLGDRKWQMPQSLEQCVIGPRTAREIGWLPESG
jgi:hypothetical protein